MIQAIGLFLILFIIVFLLSMIMVGIYEIKDLLKSSTKRSDPWWVKSLKEEVAKIK